MDAGGAARSGRRRWNAAVVLRDVVESWISIVPIKEISDITVQLPEALSRRYFLAEFKNHVCLVYGLMGLVGIVKKAVMIYVLYHV